MSAEYCAACRDKSRACKVHATRTRIRECYCHTCGRSFHSLGIARHRAAHRDRRETCTITFSNGDTYTFAYGRPS